MGLMEWAAAINPVAAIANLAVNNPISDYLMYDRQKDDQDHAARDARAWQERMTAQANEYNSPKNQMARMAEAGLNPRLIYEQINNTGWQSPPPPVKAEIPSLNMKSNMLDTLGQFQSISNMAAQGNILSQQARAAKANADIAEISAKYYKDTGIPPGGTMYDKFVNFLQRFTNDVSDVSYKLNLLPVMGAQEDFNRKMKYRSMDHKRKD